LIIAAYVGGVFAGTLVLCELGRRLGVGYERREPGGSGTFGTIEGAVFGLLALLIAFTFEGAAHRFDDRRRLIIEEANDIEVAYLRLDLLPASEQPELREEFRRYLDSRLAIYQVATNERLRSERLTESHAIQRSIWTHATTAALQVSNPAVTTLVVSSLNEMIDITKTRTAVTRIHPPLVVFWMLALLLLACAFLAGFGMARNKTTSRLHVLGFALIQTFAIFVIVEMEYPRYGLIRLTAADEFFVNLRDDMR
jgi:hypothetical protein